MENEYDIQCGYEAGYLGYSLYNQLIVAGVKCVILAPTTMLTQQDVHILTEADDFERFAKGNSYFEVAGGICKGAIGYKSKDFIVRHNGNMA